MSWLLVIALALGVGGGVALGKDLAKILIHLLPLAMFLGGVGLAMYCAGTLSAMKTEANAEFVDFISNHWFGLFLLGSFSGLVVSLTFFPMTAVLNLKERLEALEKANKEARKQSNA